MFSHKAFAKFQTVLATSTLPITLVILTPKVVHAAQFSNLYVFGDSLSDVGQVFNATSGQIPPPQLGYYQGRFSNGPIWVDYLAADLNVPSTTQTNFAFGGATSGDQNAFRPGSPGLQQEIAEFTQAVPKADPNALYVIWTGANDYLAGQTDPSIPVGNIDKAINALAQDGAKDILVVNLPDLLGKVPLVSSQGSVVSGEVSALAQEHDVLLAQTLTTLGSQLAPQGVDLISLDVNSLLNDALANPAKYGFTDVSDPCLFPSPIFFSPGPVSTCPNPNQYLFWDSLHPTTTAHQIIAAAALDAINASTVPEPPTTAALVLFGVFLAGATVLKKKGRGQKAEGRR